MNTRVIKGNQFTQDMMIDTRQVVMEEKELNTASGCRGNLGCIKADGKTTREEDGLAYVLIHPWISPIPPPV